MVQVGEILVSGEQLLALLDDSAGDLSASELGELCVGLIDIADRLAARQALLVRDAEYADTQRLDGSTSMTAWLALNANTAKGRSGQLVGTGRFLTSHKVIADAACDGTISAAHLTRLRSASETSSPCAESMAEPETQQTLIGFADDFVFDDWVLLLKKWAMTVDPDGTEKKAAVAHQDRTVELHANFAGAGYSGEIHLGNLDGTKIKEAIDRMVDRLFSQDLAETRDRLGRDPLNNELPRNRKQLRADALVELIDRGVAASPSLTRTLPLVNLHIDHETFKAALDWLAGNDRAFETIDITTMVCETIDGVAITPTETIQAVFEGHIRRIVFGGESELIDFGKKQRIFTGAAREAVLQTNRWCQHPGCRRPARWCQIDHIVAWANNGPTNISNGQALCGHHNRWKYIHHDKPADADEPAAHSHAA